MLIAAIAASAFGPHQLDAQGWGRERGQPGNQKPRHIMPQRGIPNHMLPWGPGPGGQQRMRPDGRGTIQRPDVEAVTISGNLIVAHGRPALKSGDVTYIVGGLNRLTGFVDGLKEGAQVTIEGAAFSRLKEDKTKFLRPAKLTLNGKTYEMNLPMDNMRKQEPGERALRNRPAPPQVK